MSAHTLMSFYQSPSAFAPSGTRRAVRSPEVTHADKLAQARARFGKPFACDPGSTFRFRRDRTILDDWLDTLRERRAAAQAEVPGLLREQAA